MLKVLFNWKTALFIVLHPSFGLHRVAIIQFISIILRQHMLNSLIQLLEVLSLPLDKSLNQPPPPTPPRRHRCWTNHYQWPTEFSSFSALNELTSHGARATQSDVKNTDSEICVYSQRTHMSLGHAAGWVYNVRPERLEKRSLF